MNEKYMKRLARCSVEELVRLRDFVAERKGSMRYGAMMLQCITAALMLKAGLQP